MTSPDIVARRKKLVTVLRRTLNRIGQPFPYDRILAGDWEIVVNELGKTLEQPEHEVSLRCGRLFVWLAKHAKACPCEESLVLPLAQALNGNARICLDLADRNEALLALMGIEHTLNQRVVDEVVRGLISMPSFSSSIEALYESGYAPSIDIEKKLLVQHKRSGWILDVIRRIQPRWHAMRLHAEMRELAPTQASMNVPRAGL